MSHGPAIFSPEYYQRLERLERRHWWCRSVRRVALRLIDEYAPDARLVLDAGCGTGGFLAALTARRRELSAIGADVSLDALARARGGASRLVGASVVGLPVGSGRIDLVISHDVLQHLPSGEDRGALAEAFRVLRPRGYLCLRSNLGASVSSGPALARRYDRAALSRLVADAGFRILEHIVLHPLARVWSDLRPAGRGDSHAGGHQGLSLSLPPAPVNFAMEAFTRLEDPIVRRWPSLARTGDVQVLFAQKSDRAR